jgi:hypothetical protein
MAAALVAREELVDEAALIEALRERYERVTGRPLAAACPPGCTCRGQTTSTIPEEDR